METKQEKMDQARAQILALLAELPPDSLAVVEQFVRFLHDRGRGERVIDALTTGERRPLYLYPTVSVPAERITALIGIMPPVGGDALIDS